MKRYSVLVLLVLAGLLLVSTGAANRAPALAQTPAATAAAGGDISIEPENPKATKTPPVIKTPPPTDGGKVTVDGTAVPVGVPNVDPPTTFEDLIKLYPDLKPFIDSLPAELNGTNLAELYKRIIQIYKDRGADGVATFLKDSGILDKLGIPVSYLDLLIAFGDKGDIQAVEKMARQRQLINGKDEVIGYLALDSKANLPAAKKDLEGLGVSVYSYLDNTDEVEIGIPLAILGQYKTPGPLIEYLTKIAKVNHVVGFRPPTPKTVKAFNAQQIKTKGAAFIGADKWQKAGITGKGVRIGILDMGFGGILQVAGKELPDADKIKSNIPLEDLDAQEEVHGTACAIVVHGAAPDAELYIAQFDGGSFDSWVSAVEFLIDNKVQIVNYSVGSAVGPRDGTFGDALVVDKIVEKYKILWVSSAGNEALNHTMFQYKDNGKGLHAFSDKLAALPFVPFAPVATVIMNWNGNWNGGEKNEFAFKIVDKEGNEVGVGAEPKKGRKNDFPVQVGRFEVQPKQLYFMLVSKRTKSAPNATLDIFIPNSLFPDWAQVPDHSITVPADANGSLTVGATGLTKDDLEPYSSQGPTNDDRIKPDVTAPTGETVSVYTDGGFSGTSGAAPLVAGAAGLVLQKFPEMSPEELKAFLTNNVKDLGDDGTDPVFGAGRIALPDPGKVSNDDPGTTDATPVPDTQGPTAEITNIDTKFNVKRDGVKGMAISLSFTVDNFKGKKGIVAVVFFEKSGKPVLTDDPTYRLKNGALAAIGTFTAKSDKVAFDDAVLFIPNSAFSKLGSGTKDLYYIVIIADPESPDQPLATSDKVNIKFKK